MDGFHTSTKRNGSSLSSSNGAAAIAPVNPGPSRAQRAKSLHGYEYVRERRVLKVLKLVQAQPLLRIRDVAQEVHLSKSRLEHMFKQETGVCLGHLLTEKRLQRAADLLVHSDMRVKEIASSVGYVHAPSFIRAFVRRFRESPREYRNRKGANY